MEGNRKLQPFLSLGKETESVESYDRLRHEGMLRGNLT